VFTYCDCETSPDGKEINADSSEKGLIFPWQHVTNSEISLRWNCEGSNDRGDFILDEGDTWEADM
jgi:hypothetical protein